MNELQRLHSMTYKQNRSKSVIGQKAALLGRVISHTISYMKSPRIMIAILFFVAALFVGVFIATTLLKSEPSLDSIRAAVHEKLSESIELTDIKIERHSVSAKSDDQLILYSATARIKEDYIKRLNPFDWQDQCDGGRDGRTTRKEISGTTVYQIIAQEGSTLKMVGRMRAYRDKGDWSFTARNRHLMDNDSTISGKPISTVTDVLLTNTIEFDELCASVFED